MMDIVVEYVLFLAKTVTVVIAIWGFVLLVASVSRRKERAPDRLKIRNLNQKYRSMERILKREILSRTEFKKFAKREKTRKKEEARKPRPGSVKDSERRIFVLNFRGDIKATAGGSLREETTAVLTLATPQDEVLVRLENTGGLVNEHGFAASQLRRFREKGIPLTVAVDKVAASGGYLMACTANRIIAAPFAVIGSIGVLAQLPNFHRLLDKTGIDFEQIMAGQFKRTITMFGKNTDEERDKLREQLEETHTLFKEQVRRHRPQVEIDKVSTGEYWYGTRALELKLVDEIVTSDDYLLSASQAASIYEVTYTVRKTIPERMAAMVQLMADRVFQAIGDRLSAFAGPS